MCSLVSGRDSSGRAEGIHDQLTGPWVTLELIPNSEFEALLVTELSSGSSVLAGLTFPLPPTSQGTTRLGIL